MKKKKILLIIITLIGIIALTIGCIAILNSTKEKYIECTASEEKDGITTKVTSKYNYNKKTNIIESIDYSIELSGTMNDNQIAASKQLFENTICNKSNQPNNITCNIEVEKNKLTVSTHEDINNNESSLLGLKDLNKLTYEKFKENQDKDSECIYK